MAKIAWDSERELEDYIYNKMDELCENPINGMPVHWFGRQVDLSAYGIVDLMTIYFDGGHINIDVIEIKKEKITVKTIAQISRYIAGIHHFFRDHANGYPYAVRGIVVAPEFDFADDCVFILNLTRDIEAYTVNFNMDAGVSFNDSQSRWVKSSPDFAKFNALYGVSMLSDFKNNKEWFENLTEEPDVTNESGEQVACDNPV